MSGSGYVSSALAGVTSQAVGEPLEIKAVPDPGYIFAGWTGSIVSASATLKFTMQNGLNLQANFVPNPFLAVSGAYYGMLSSGSDSQNGLLRLELANNGAFTGRILMAGKAWSFIGTLSSSGSASVTLPGKNPVTITLQADLTGGSGDITGTVTEGGDTFDFTINQATYSASTNPAPEVGRYTLVLGPDPNVTGTNVPQGDGYAAIVVSANGSATIAGRLADGTPYSATGHVANDATLAVYCVPSGAPSGSSLTGLLTFNSTNESDIEGTLAWTKNPRARDAFYPAGFSVQLPAVGSLYAPPGPGLQPMDVSPGAASAGFSGGNIAPTTVAVSVSQQDKVTMVTPGEPELTLSINPVSGAISGSFKLPGGNNVSRGIRGIVLQKQQAAYGYFRGLDECGSFSLTQ